VDWTRGLTDVEDLLFPAYDCNSWERVLYYYLLRQTAGAGNRDVLVSIQALAQALPMSESTARETIRSLADKGPIVIVERTRKGHLLRALLPEELGLARPDPAVMQEDPERADYYANRTRAPDLLR